MSDRPGRTTGRALDRSLPGSSRHGRESANADDATGSPTTTEALLTGRERAPDREPFEPRPSATGAALALSAGLVAVLGLAATAPSFVLGTAGLLSVAAGLGPAADRLVGAGAVALFGGVLVAGAFGTPVELLLVAAGAAVVTWDVAANARSLGAQLGRRADTRRAELVHAAGSAVVATLGAGVPYAVFRAVGGDHPLLALVLLLLGAVLLAAVLDGTGS